MIFSVDGSIEKIKTRKKWQTRRPTDRYQVGKSYAIQPGRTKPGIPDGRILITDKWEEEFSTRMGCWITAWDADAEGGYTPADYESIYQKMYPNWTIRYAYEFEFVEGGNP